MLMEKQPLVSVIVPAYNAEDFISETIESVVSQTYSNIELLLVNDGSLDSTGKICREYVKVDGRIKYYEKANSGVSDTRNYGLSCVSGEYIVFLDADDSLPEDAIAVLVAAITAQECDAVFAGHCNVYGNTSLPRLMRLSNGVYTYDELKHNLLDDGTLTGILFGSVCGACYRTSFVRKKNISFKREIKVNEDGLFNIEVVRLCSAIRVIDNVVYRYRQWKNSKKISLHKDVRFETSEPEILQTIEQFGEKSVFDIQFKRRQVSVAFWNALRVQNSNAGHKDNLLYLKNLFSEVGLQECFRCLDYKRMNVYKRILCFFMKHKLVFLFYVSIRYLLPLLSRLIKR